MKLRGLKNITMLAAITVTVMLIAGLAACGGSEQPHATEQPTVANSQVAGPEQVRFNFPDKDYSEFNHDRDRLIGTMTRQTGGMRIRPRRLAVSSTPRCR